MQRYKILDKLGSGSMGVVFRVYDRLTRQEVALKQVIRQDALSLEDDLARLSVIREFRTLAGLRHPNIIDVLDFGFTDDQTPFFTMQLLTNTRTIQQAIIGTTLQDGMNMVIQVLQALSYLHRQGIVHRDLKPNNVLVTADGVVKLLDFGLAANIRTIDNTPAGTIAYMSPELIKGEAASPASDLFAVGVMIYELLAGQHPFAGKNVSEMLNNILLREPDLTPLTSGQWMVQVKLPDAIEDRTVIINESYTPNENVAPFQMPIDIQDSLALVIYQLLVKNPKDRDFDAYSVIDSLCEAIGSASPHESEAIRYSVLHAARFVGRHAELDQLLSALSHTAANRGSSWLIAGEAGVGKTRLIDEVRVRALVDGVLVLRGQAVEHGGYPYKLWRDVLPKLLLDTVVTDEEAAILSHVLPSIGDILERPITPSAETDKLPQKISDTVLALFRRLNKPTLLIMEDVHWAIDCLPILRQLADQSADLPLMIVAAYRSDDAPYFYGQLYNMQQIVLERLNDDDLRELCHSILGDHPRTTDITDFLIRETEGNVFFVIDVLQTLAYNLPRIDEIGHERPLPEAVIAQGVMELAMRRVDRLPFDMRPMMRVAAVAGREIDFDILRHIDDELQYEDWLSDAVNAAIVEYVDDRWRFQHDKLREGILFGLMDEERPRLHRLVAEAIEQVYASRLEEFARTLTYHWRIANDLTKEALYVGMVAKSLIDRGEYKRAEEMIKPTLDRMDEAPTRQRMELVRMYADARATDGSGIERIELYGQVMSMAQALGDRHMEMRSLYDIAWMWLRRYQQDTARTYFERSLGIAETLNDQLYIGHNINGLGAGYFQSDPERAVGYFIQARDIYQSINSDYNIALVNNNLGVYYQERGDFERGEQYLRESLAAQERLGNRHTIAHALLNLSRLEMVRNNLDSALEHLQGALRHFRDTGYEIGLITVNIYRAWIDLSMPESKPLNAIHLMNAALDLAEKTDNPSLIHRSLILLPRAHIMAGRLPQARNALIRLDAQSQVLQLRPDGVLWVLLMLAFYALQHEAIEDALQAACAVQVSPACDFMLKWQLAAFWKQVAVSGLADPSLADCQTPVPADELLPHLRAKYLG